MKEKRKMNLNQKEISMLVVFGILVILMITSVIVECVSLIKKSRLGNIDELRVARTYATVMDGDDLSQSEKVKFDAYVAKDIDGDGFAEKLRGTCKKIGQSDTLYMQLNVQGGGTFKNGMITINGENFYLSTGLVAGDVIKENYFSVNTKVINLNDITEATSTLITGNIQSGNYNYDSLKTAAIKKNNINNLSSESNEIVLTGTFVDESGEEIFIEKKVNLTVDWYGSLNLQLRKTYQSGVLNTDNSALTFEIWLEDAKKELLLSNLYVEGEIPQIEGYYPEDVVLPIGGTYDSTTKKFVIKLDSQVDEEGNVINILDSANILNITCVYPREAFISDTLEDKYANVPIKAYCEGYNNERVGNKIIKSNEIESGLVLKYTKSPVEATYSMGLYLGGDDLLDHGRDSLNISKKNAIKGFINSDSIDNEFETYSSIWQWQRIKNNQNDVIVLYQKYPDTIDREDLEGTIINTGIKIEGNIENLLGSDGYINLYNADNDELIKRLEKDDFNKVYEYNDSTIKRIKLETSPTINAENNDDLGGIRVINYKKIDNLAFSRNVPNDKYDEKLEKLLSYKDIYTSYYYYDSYREKNAKFIDYTSDMELRSNQTMFSSQISNNAIINLQAKNLIWKDGKFLIKFPKELTKLDINSINTQYGLVTISKYRTFKENDNTFLEIETKNLNQYDQEFNVLIDANLEFDTLTTSGTYKIEAYGSNPNYEIYSLDKRINDIYNLSQTSNYVSYTTLNINVVAPNNLVTSERLLDQNGNVLARPSEQVEIDKEGLGGTRKISISVLNNYSSGSLKDIFIVGKVPFKDNKYQIANDDMKSEFTTTMTNSGISIPSELQGLVNVYYSENEIVTRDLNDSSNNWTKDPTDFTKIKSYMIDLSRVNLEYKKGYNFTYDIQLPNDSEYNKSSYSSHAVYFGLNTNEGILSQEFETNKMGIVVAKKMNFELIKLEELTDNVVSGSTYRIWNDTSSFLQTTDSNGKINVEGLYIEKEYNLQEVNENKDYEKDSQIIRFNTYMENGELKISTHNGKIRSSQARILPNNMGYASITVDTIPKYTLCINKFEQNTTNLLSGVKFKFVGENGESVIITNSNGNIVLNRMLQGFEYTLKEVEASGYKPIEDIKFKVEKNQEGNDYVLSIIQGRVRQDSNISRQEGKIPQLTLNIENERLNSYTFELSKLEKDNNDNSISNTKFNLKGKWLAESGIELYTGDDGKLRVDLYDGVEYTLQETEAAQGYVLNNSKIKFKATRNINGQWNLEVMEGSFKSDAEFDYTSEKATIKVKLENERAFTLIKKDEETGELLKGVKFAIYEVNKLEDQSETLSDAYDVNGNIVGTEETINGVKYRVLETDARGTISTLLRKGIYKAIEVEALEGYTLPDINERTYYFGIGEHLEGDYTIDTVFEREDIVELDIEKTLDGGYIGVHDKTITKYDSDFNVMWSNDSRTSQGYNKYQNYFQKVIQTNDGGYVAIALDCLVKYNSNGDEEWAKSSSGVKYSDVIQTRDGNLIVGILFDNYHEHPDYTYAGSYIFSVRKFDLAGNQIWKNDLTACTLNDQNRVVDVNLIEDEDENCISCLNRTGVNSPALLYKLNKNGDEIWSTAVGEVTELSGMSEWLCLYDGCISDDGGYIWVGTVSSYAQYGIYGKNSTFNDGNSLKLPTGVIVKLNSNGEIVWMKENTNTNLFIGIKKLDNNTYVLQGEKTLYLYDKNFRKIGEYTLSSPMFSTYKKHNLQESMLMTEGDVDQYSKFITLGNDKILVAGNDCFDNNNYKNNKMTLLSLSKGEAIIPEAQKIVVNNSLKEYNIITHAEENGNISGNGEQYYEKVKHGKDAIKDIDVTANEGYVVGKITINGENYSYSESENGVVSLPKFKNVKEDKIITASFVPKANLGYVDVEFRDIDTNEEIYPKYEIRSTIGETYQADPQMNIDGYKLVVDRLPSNRIGVISSDRTIVTYYYRKVPVKITIRHLDIDTREAIANEVTDYKNVNEQYTTTPLQSIPEEYILHSNTNNTSGVVTGKEKGNEITVEYYYKVKEFNIKTRVGTKGGTITGSEKNIYETVKYGMSSSKDIIVSANENWYIDTITVNGKEIGFTEDENRSYKLDQFTSVKEDIEVVANFKCKKAIITVIYLDKSTNEKIADDEVIELSAGESYETVAKDIEGYDLVQEPENKTGIMGSEDITVIYYYQKQPSKDPEIPSISETPQTPLTGNNLIVLIICILICTLTALVTNIKLKRGEINAK